MGSLQESLLGPMEEAWAWALAQPLHMQLIMAAGFIVVTTLFINSLLGMMNSKRPPIIAGLPLIGGFLKFVKGPMPLMDEAYKKYGSVFTVPIFHK
eukprot:8726281-Pyramimonas_sp.AAC.1